MGVRQTSFCPVTCNDIGLSSNDSELSKHIAVTTDCLLLSSRPHYDFLRKVGTRLCLLKRQLLISGSLSTSDSLARTWALWSSAGPLGAHGGLWVWWSCEVHGAQRHLVLLQSCTKTGRTEQFTHWLWPQTWTVVVSQQLGFVRAHLLHDCSAREPQRFLPECRIL